MNRNLLHCILALSSAAASFAVAPAQAAGEAPARVHVDIRLAERSPENVEQRVTLPLEHALIKMPGLLRMKSSSAQELCRLELEFEGGATEQRKAQVGAEVAAELARSKIEPRTLSIELGPAHML